MNKILLPDGFHYTIHTESFLSEKRDAIIGVLSGNAHGSYVHDILPREARLIHQKLMFTLGDFSCAIEIALPADYARQIMTNTLNVDNAFGKFCRTNWTHVFDLFPIEGLRHTDLFRSNEQCIEYFGKKWKIKFWFCGPKIDCGIHNEHDCIEWHIGIAGDGRMEKFSDKNQDTLVESWRMSPGQSHPIFAYPDKKDSQGNPLYPYHRWVGGNAGDLWMVVEEYF